MSRALNSRWPLSLGWFWFTGVIVLLQWFPPTGIVLMLLAAMFWPVITINLGFISLGLEAWSGRISRAWMIAPVIWFAGYGLVAGVNKLGAEMAVSRIEGANAAAGQVERAPIDHIVISGQALNDTRRMAQNIVFARDVTAYTPDSQSPTGFVAYTLVENDFCDTMRADYAARAAEIGTRRMKIGRGVISSRLSDRVCIVDYPATPPETAVQAAVRTEDRGGLWLPRTLDQIVIQFPDAEPVRASSARIVTLRWIPMPVAGCGLNSNEASWDCGMMFLWGWRDAAKDQNQTPAPAIAAAAGLEERIFLEDGEPVLEDGARPGLRSELNSLIEARLVESERNLDTMTAYPSSDLSMWDVAGLQHRPERLAAKADALVSGLERALVLEHGRERAQDFQGLIAVLPDADFARVKPRVARAFAAHPELDERYLADELMERFAAWDAAQSGP